MNVGDRVEVKWWDDVWKAAVVQDLLNSQFTAIVDVDGGPLRFSFYNEKNVTWRIPNATTHTGKG